MLSSSLFFFQFFYIILNFYLYEKNVIPDCIEFYRNDFPSTTAPTVSASPKTSLNEQKSSLTPIYDPLPTIWIMHLRPSCSPKIIKPIFSKAIA